MKPDYKLVAKAKYIHTTADLASEIWHEVYKRYYPGKQLDTLVEELAAFAYAIRRGDRERLRDMLRHAREIKETIDKDC